MIGTALTAALRRHREGFLLGGLMLSLGAAVAVEAMPSGSPDPLTVTRMRALPKLDVHAADATKPAPQWQQTVLDRPLFALDRRPIPIDATPDSTMPRLSGTIRFASTALAIFEIPATSGNGGNTAAKSMVLGIGAAVAGWTIQSVSDERVLLTKGGQIRSLNLAFSKTPPQPAKHADDIRVLHGKKTNVFFQP